MIIRENLLGTAGATFSDCERYRYLLWRKWGEGSICNFVMLNPSTADENANDPTVERCERRARQWGFDGVYVTNLFALRSTDPSGLRVHPEPTGQPENGIVILDTAKRSGLVICAWGNHGSYRGRDAEVKRFLQLAGIKLHALQISKTGQPGHPLYIPYSLQPQGWHV